MKIALSKHAKEQILRRFTTKEFSALYLLLQDIRKAIPRKVIPRPGMPYKKLYLLSFGNKDIWVSISDDDTVLSLWICGADGTGEIEQE